MHPAEFPPFLDTPNIYIDPGVTYVVVDFETLLLDNPSATNPEGGIVLACWEIHRPDGTIERKHQWGDEYSQAELVKDVTESDFYVAQNSKFEHGWLTRCGLDPYDNLAYDTMLGAWVLHGNRKLPRNLSALSKSYGGSGKVDLVSMMIKNGICPSQINPTWLLEYCYMDVTITADVFKHQIKELQATNQLHLVHVRNLAAMALTDIEFKGMDLDPIAVNLEYQQTVRKRNMLKQQLLVATGGVLLSSTKQLGEYLYDTLKFEELTDRNGPIRTASGIRSTASDVIKKLEVKTIPQKRFLEMYFDYNRADSLISKNLEFFHGVVQEHNGNFKAKFQQGVTVTHRLSSAGIPLLFKGQSKAKSTQFQNMPREYKRLFWSGSEDYLIGECDGAQLEFRVAADVCNDAVARDEILNGSDIHSFTAQVLTDAGEPTTRQNAKASTFAPLYGGMGSTPAQRAYAEFFKAKYEGIANTQYGWCMEVAATQQVKLPWGMIFYWPDAKINAKNGRLNVSTEVHNYPVQSFATGDIIPIALVHFWYRARHTDITIINTIHDSIVTRLKIGDEELFEYISQQSLTTDVFDYLSRVYDYHFTVPLGAGIKVSRNWGATPHERTYSVFPDGTTQIKDK